MLTYKLKRENNVVLEKLTKTHRQLDESFTVMKVFSPPTGGVNQLTLCFPFTTTITGKEKGRWLKKRQINNEHQMNYE